MLYGAFVALGIVAGLAATRHAPPDGIPAPVAKRVKACALIGAVIGAHLFELPADLFGWAAPVPGHEGSPVLGRTVLGGILGGWAGVELAKASVGFRGATGDRFAAPLAIALAFGRLGCVTTGCCPGRAIEPGSPWAALSIVHADPPRFPATLVEAYFHAGAALALVLAARAQWLPGRRLAVYLAALAVLRFVLERWRDNPEVLGGLTYYQWLCVPLFVISVGTIVARSRAPRANDAR
ncbi:prolipoprotein diacylglyceryl transferase [Sandaracinus amylolyticus]|uniref:Prolipoprotein diacylglyceryl transferase n=1 Tax=Sandaracinus amylolyticus TaxID=927083 RepID=A0A0F6W6R1_9BACT|nr:prolipoprotein diacylglyceryl transferase family protein [Sandaracinus amylolyticus]AKF08925.1 Prolipoprotein diacylglyceryl transferase [Sandaracinus amylolyticus]